MDLVDKQDRVLFLLDLVDYRLEPLFKITAITRSGQNRTHIEREELCTQQNLRHVALAYLQSESLSESSLAYAGLANIQRVIFLAAA